MSRVNEDNLEVVAEDLLAENKALRVQFATLAAENASLREQGRQAEAERDAARATLERERDYFRRHPMRHLLILIAILPLACHRLVPTPAPVPVPVPTPVPDPVPRPDDMATQLLDAHNRERASRGLPALTLSPKLVAAAQAHSDYQARVGRMAHEGIGDGSPWDRMEAAGYSYSSAAENVAEGQADTAAVMRAWMGSWGHRANILGGCSEFGGAMAAGQDGSPFWTTCFGTPGRPAFGAAPVDTGPPVVTESEGGRLIPPATFGGGR